MRPPSSTPDVCSSTRLTHRLYCQLSHGRLVDFHPLDQRLLPSLVSASNHSFLVSFARVIKRSGLVQV